MNQDEKEKLWLEFSKRPTPELREKIIIEYAGLVKIVAGKLSIYLGFTHISNQVCKSGTAYLFLVRLKIFHKRIIADVIKMDNLCRTQVSQKTYELLSWCVMLTLSAVAFKLIL